MLILTRREGETIKIGDDITITMIEWKRGQMVVGIDAPKDVAVHREEVYAKIERELKRLG